MRTAQLQNFFRYAYYAKNDPNQITFRWTIWTILFSFAFLFIRSRMKTMKSMKLYNLFHSLLDLSKAKENSTLFMMKGRRGGTKYTPWNLPITFVPTRWRSVMFGFRMPQMFQITVVKGATDASSILSFKNRHYKRILKCIVSAV